MIKSAGSKEFDAYFRSILDIDGFSAADASLNGLQVDNDGGTISKIAFAVDACMETFKRAAAAGAGLLFVHHGLLWGNPLRVTGLYRERLKFLLDNNIVLYACHLPLDEHPDIGNNAVLSEKLGMKNITPFGLYHGRKIGYKGELAEPLNIDAAAERISFMSRPPAVSLPFGKAMNTTCAVISGGAAMEAVQAIEEGIDLYITGECSHSVYHFALEGSLNMLCGGHYLTEVWGVRKLMEKTAADLSIETLFIDVPTGL
ncbi:MAG: Nif3-like dinuclear metal center hexameric protein [Spirochaetaceae bacterium]|jgi:dinuclear metal center YbgI/SA1388 family protein|nr:Nif3-like dinuclear metal center hexameric protein [Spirochaetaceae bacterium]